MTTHGFAVNVENDLQPFLWIVPCGLEGVQMTSLIQETARLRADAVLSQAGGVRSSRRRSGAASGWSAWRVSRPRRPP